MRARPAVVLVHSPLVGPETWRRVATELELRGWAVGVPVLTPAFAADPPYTARLAAVAAAGADRVAEGRPAVLVGHSGAGPLLPAVAAAASSDVVGAVAVDAPTPHPGRSLLATLPDAARADLLDRARSGYLPPWDAWFPPGTIEGLVPDAETLAEFRAGLPRVPVDYLEEPAPDVAGFPPLRSAYLRLSDAYAAPAERAEREGWRVERLDSHHLAPLTDPGPVAAAVARLVEDVAR
jgi:hypothetical protein